MAEWLRYGFVAIMLVATIAFCLLLYPPITEKLKESLALKEQKNYEEAKKYGDFSEAIRGIITANVITALWYVVYFFMATQYLISRFGSFPYGDNDETFLYLVCVGIPYVACYLHFILKAGKHQMAIKKSNLQDQDKDLKVFWCTFLTPMVLLIVVVKIFQLSVSYPERNVFLLWTSIK